jgi:ferredoxin
VKVRVDRDRCQGHNRCYDIAPDLFDLDDFGNAMAARDGTVPSEREADARRAALSCPEQAILIEDGAT